MLNLPISFPGDHRFLIRNLNKQDLPFCAKLVKQAGWNQIDTDWLRVMVLDPAGCFIVEKEGQNAGTIVFTRFGEVAWISMVLVAKEYRGQGIGQIMFGYVLEELRKQGIQTIRLDATDMGVNLYKKYGFREEYEVIRLTCDHVSAAGERNGKLASPNDITQVAELDYKITGTSRQKLIKHLAEEDETRIFAVSQVIDRMSGYVCLRPGRSAWQIGPCIADDPESGTALLDAALEMTTGQKAIIDIPVENKVGLLWARAHYFIEQRRFIRMYSGQKLPDQPTNIFASFGPEKG